MKSVMSALRDTVPINQFNRGLAGKIFEEVKKSGAKVVMKNNTAECVLLSPDEYAKLIDEICDARLLLLASDRMSRADLSKTVSQEEVYRELGLSAADLLGEEDVELE
ncbi:type II toxin-antitoxin system Phd/YefM family antitoxin [Stomatobaculum sp. F0698]|uniref:type II toxin-antitoxin system Phd/YefM family antitoxin n=1 Tax=Stomatobaculum sp. F0698 TaxID=3059030 RepID=UPI00272C92D1|nr:type II toxin-antitoxin system Phd/YefM family antitoxin [Stomatobaculum sp. F0698]WLD87213.1 type II toxin-antitoxin system Phd/YefM family antitoxin [Stomatobaculum sp. F0698]